MGDSMIEDLITEGDVVIMRPVPESRSVARQSSQQWWTWHNIKALYRQGDRVTLKPATQFQLKLLQA